MRLKTDDELIAIWQKNDHTEWTDSAFDVVKEILIERHIALPQQNLPIQLEDKDSESTADKMLHEFQIKNSLSSLLLLGWYFCLLQVFLLMAGGLLWVGSLVYHTGFNFQNLWFTITFAMLAIPIYFWRKRIDNELNQLRSKLSTLINKALG